MTYRALLRRPDARRYLFGQTVSFFGDSSMWMACGIWVKTLTGSNAAAGLTFFFYLLPALLNPPAGLLSDRVRRRPFLVAANLAGAVMLLPLLAVHGSGDVWLIYLVLTCYGVITVMIGPAQSALLAHILPASLLGTANGALRGGQETLRILAPLAGAGLFEWLGGKAVTVLDMATFVIAAALTWSIQVHEDRPAPSRQHLGTDLTAGLRFLYVTAVLRRTTFACALFMLVAGFGESARWAIVSEGLHQRPAFVAILLLALGIGAIFGSAASARLVSSAGEHRVMAFGFALFSIGAALSVASSLWLVLLGSLLFGAAAPLAVVAALTLLQRTSPSMLQGRVYSAFELATAAPQIASIAIGAALINAVGYRVLLALMAVAGIVAAAFALSASQLVSKMGGDRPAAEKSRA